MNVGKLVVFGVGLIGGSVALALKEKNAVTEVVGIGRSQANLDDALRLSVIDRAATLDSAWENEVADAAMILIAVPVTQTLPLLRRVLPAVSTTAIITDAGSTKGDVIDAARLAYRENPRASFALFVPAHPIAGTEHSGATAAFSTLYQSKKTVMTPLEETDQDAVTRVASLWAMCGAEVRVMSPEAHDAIFAAVSHLPHALSFALVETLAKRDNAKQLFDYAGSGFRDFTRIAASSPEMWKDIARGNKKALVAEIDAYIRALNEMRDEIKNDKSEALLSRFTLAAQARRRWQK